MSKPLSTTLVLDGVTYTIVTLNGWFLGLYNITDELERATLAALEGAV